ncbi:hypothetical protein FAZ19_23490 [Sphingobacterium alkalisoli]|uniref:Uncharacterized protein n=1 Tax=Sphingobacterium alkalisoli TaxID=1874115 RepID=A0A4U0GLZ2_9SPHI|nr:hypothetical protein FAZ19_23490 [Sphingobacterium alkalisoli]GGH32960.1 hypothetical protein GCM10011418_46830 [Sphingobacterium alkalisoli]
MPKLKCVCSYVINLSEIPSPNQYLIISDVEMDRYVGEIDIENLYLAMKVVAHCQNCGRLHVFYEGFDKEPVVYKIDS